MLKPNSAALVRLDVSYCALDADALLFAIAEHAPLLAALRANCLDGASDAGVRALCEAPCAQRLETLHFEARVGVSVHVTATDCSTMQ